MSTPCIITVAITGSVPTKKDSPAVPITVAEQVESTHAAYEAGAALVHVHVRNDDGTTTSDPGEVRAVPRRHPQALPRHDRAVLDGRAQRPGQGARRHVASQARDGVADDGLRELREDHLREPSDADQRSRGEHARRTTSSRKSRSSISRCCTTPPSSWPTACSRRPSTCSSCSASRARCRPTARCSSSSSASSSACCPGATWTAAGIGRHQLTVNEWALELGGHCRTGLEDNLRFDKERLATSNAELVQRVAALAGRFGRSVATPAEARQILGLRAA